MSDNLNNFNYDSQDDYYDYQDDNRESGGKSLKGYKIIIILLVVLLIAVSLIYFMQSRERREEFQMERDTLQSQISSLITEIDGINYANDTLSVQLAVERGKADSLMTSLQKERNINRSTIKKYEQELGTLRTVMKRYVEQVDSLNRVNKTLAQENVNYRLQVTNERMRAEAAEERATELTDKIRVGSVVRARDIRLLALNANDKEVSRSNRAARLRVDFVLVGNELTEPGERYIYARVIHPDGYVMSENSGMFEAQGERMSYSASREVDYQNKDLNVSIYYNGEDITGGKYRVEIYMDGYKIGSSEISLK